MPRISMLIPDEDLRLIDSVSDNRTAFMLSAAVREAKRRRRELRDEEIARACAENAERDMQVYREWEGTLADGLEPDDVFEDPYAK